MLFRQTKLKKVDYYTIFTSSTEKKKLLILKYITENNFVSNKKVARHYRGEFL